MVFSELFVCVPPSFCRTIINADHDDFDINTQDDLVYVYILLIDKDDVIVR